MTRKASILPLSVYPLLLLLAAALLWLRCNDDEAPQRRLFPVMPDEIASLRVVQYDSHPARVVELVRTRGGWRIEGSLADLADAPAVADLLGALCEEHHSAPLAVADWPENAAAFGLAAPRTVLRLTTADERDFGVDIGARNTSTGVYYARLPHDGELVLVQPKLAQRLASLPDAVRAVSLWPAIAIAEIDTVDLSRSGVADRFSRDAAGRWWLHPPADGSSRYGGVLREYMESFGDRRRADGAVRARDERIEDLLYRLGRTIVKTFLPPGRPAALPGNGFRVAGEGFAHSVEVAGDLSGERQTAWRDGLPGGLIVTGKAVSVLLEPLSDLLHVEAIAGAVVDCDSLRLTGADGRSVKAVHGDDDQWRPLGSNDTTLREVLGDLIHFLDHLEIERTWPPDPEGADRLRLEPRYTLRLWRDDVRQPVEDIVFGRLRDADSVVAWFPAESRLAAVPAGMLVFCREYLSMVSDRTRRID